MGRTLTTLLLLAAGGYMAAYTLRSRSIDLRYFAPDEFGASWPLMSDEILKALDQFRDRLGEPLQISPASGALARALGGGHDSLHNVDVHGRVYAADVLIPEGYSLRGAYDAARASGLFSGIGVYPDWQPRPGLHLDVRHAVSSNPTPEADTGDPATWAGVENDKGKQVYVAASEAFNRGGWFS